MLRAELSEQIRVSTSRIYYDRTSLESIGPYLAGTELRQQGQLRPDISKPDVVEDGDSSAHPGSEMGWGLGRGPGSTCEFPGLPYSDKLSPGTEEDWQHGMVRAEANLCLQALPTFIYDKYINFFQPNSSM